MISEVNIITNQQLRLTFYLSKANVHPFSSTGLMSPKKLLMDQVQLSLFSASTTVRYMSSFPSLSMTVAISFKWHPSKPIIGQHYLENPSYIFQDKHKAFEKWAAPLSQVKFPKAQCYLGFSFHYVIILQQLSIRKCIIQLILWVIDD